MFDFGTITTWFDNLLESVMPGWAATVIECVIIGVALLLVYALLALFYILYERKLQSSAASMPFRPDEGWSLGIAASFRRYVQDSYQGVDKA